MTNELVGSRGREARDHCLNEMILVGKNNTIQLELKPMAIILLEYYASAKVS